jgi:hypothetical protein
MESLNIRFDKNVKKKKEYFSEEEVIKLINDFHNHSYGEISQETKDKWINENVIKKQEASVDASLS